MGRKRRRRSRKSSNAAIYWIFGIFAFLAIGGTLTWLLIKRGSHSSDNLHAADDSKVSSELKNVREELDKSDPGWRLRELAANQRKLDDSKNGAKLVLKIYSQVPKGVPTSLVDITGKKQQFQAPIADPDLNQLRANLQQCGQLVVEARKLSAYADGAYWIDWNFKKPIDTPLPHETASRGLCALLKADAFVRASAGDGQGAAESANALVNMSYYQRDEPNLIGQLVRIVIRQQAINALERAMTCANVPDETLVLLQRSLEAEAATSGLRAAVRGERASTDQWATSAAKGETDWGRFKVSDDDVAWYIREMNAMVALADKPFLKHSANWQAIENEVLSSNRPIKNLMPAINKVNYKIGRSDALMQAAAIAMAAERYRLAKGNWPSEINQLAPTYLKAAPIDRYTGEPFRIARVSGGFSVYSLAKGAWDGKGEFHTIGFADHETVGFRLLDANSRK